MQSEFLYDLTREMRRRAIDGSLDSRRTPSRRLFHEVRGFSLLPTMRSSTWRRRSIGSSTMRAPEERSERVASELRRL